MKIQGMERVKRILDSLGTRTQIQIIRAGMKRAVKPTINAARQNAPKRSGKLKKSIGSLNSRDEQGFPGIITGARKKIAPHAHLIEYGTSGVVKRLKKNPKTKNRYKVGQRYRPATAPNPFMRKAIMSTKRQVINEVANEIAEVLRRKIKRA